jgi:hypothetical protein
MFTKRRKRVSSDQCTRCLGKGYWAKNFSLPDDRARNSDSGRVNLLSNNRNTKADVYINAVMHGKPMHVLLDTGCEISLLGARCINESKYSPTTEESFAANGVKVPLLGELIVDLKIGSNCVPTRFLVSSSVNEVYLGIDFLMANKCKWDFKAGYIEIDGCRAQLHSRTIVSSVRRIYVERSLVVPASQQINVPVELQWSDLRSPLPPCNLEVKVLSPGVLTAETLINGDKFKSCVPVMNLQGKPYRLRKGAYLG